MRAHETGLANQKAARRVGSQPDLLRTDQDLLSLIGNVVGLAHKRGYVAVLGLEVDLPGRAGLDGLALVHHHDLVGEAEGLLLVVGHKDHGNVQPPLEFLELLTQLDPQGGVDLAEVKRLYGDRVCLIGNVNCGLLQTGDDEACDADVRRALRQGMEGWGYVFATSNCVYTGLTPGAL